VRKRVTVLLHDNDFSDLTVCTFWIPAGQPLSNYTMRGFATQAWTNATVSFYPATVGSDQWIRLDNVTLRRTGNSPQAGTECVEPVAGALGGIAVPGATAASAPRPVTPVDTETGGWLGTGGFSPTADGASGGPGAAWRAEAWTTGRAVLRLLAPIDLTHATAAHLTFQSWLSAGASSGAVQASIDGVTWQTVTLVPPSDAWTLVDVDLSAFVGQVVSVRFVYDAIAPPTGVAPEVWRIDQLTVDITPGPRRTTTLLSLFGALVGALVVARRARRKRD
jgi:hypothetical protein